MGGNLADKNGSALNLGGWGVRVRDDEKLGAAAWRERPGFSMHLGGGVYTGPTRKACRGHNEPQDITRVMRAFHLQRGEAAFGGILVAPNVLCGGSASCREGG